MVTPVVSILIFFAGVIVGLAFKQDLTHPCAKCRYCHNAHEKQGHDDLLARFSE